MYIGRIGFSGLSALWYIIELSEGSGNSESSFSLTSNISSESIETNLCILCRGSRMSPHVISGFLAFYDSCASL